MAVNLRKALGLLVKAEQPYTQIAKDLGEDLGPDSRNRILQRRADIALYDEDRPKLVIEVKKFAEGMNVQEIDTDLHKGDPVPPLSKLVCAAVMVCETETGDDLGVRTGARRNNRLSLAVLQSRHVPRWGVALVFRLRPYCLMRLYPSTFTL